MHARSNLATSFIGFIAVAACGNASNPPAGPKSVPVAIVDAGQAPQPKVAAAIDAGIDTSHWLAPCANGSAEHTKAAADLEAMSKAIDALALTADPKPLATKLKALYQARCFDLGRDDFAVDKVDAALSLKTYWRAGGQEDLAARLGWDRPAERALWPAPTLRKTLTTENAPQHVLAPLLCPVKATEKGASPCGRETDGWELRANRALEQHARVDRATVLDMDPPGVLPKSDSSCAAEASAGPKDEAFLSFRDCVEDIPVRQDALPLGKFQAPKDGWLVIRGRRGTYRWCNELRAYDLATGAAYVAASCGGVRAPKTSTTITKGRLPLEPLREAAWMMMLAGTVERGVLLESPRGHFIPDEIAIRAPKEQHPHMRGIGAGVSNVRTTLVFQWVRDGKSAVVGTVNWPDAFQAAHEHATSLLAIAEAGLVEGCPPAGLPAIPWSARTDPSKWVAKRAGAVPAYDEAEFAGLEKELAAVKRGCP